MDKDSEIIAALLKLEQNPDQALVHISKVQGICLLQALLLAIAAPIHNLNFNKLSSVCSQITEKVSKDSIVFQEIIDSCWDRRLVNMTDAAMLSELERIGNEVVNFPITRIEAWQLVSAVQLVSRHQTFKDSEPAKTSRAIALGLQSYAATEGILALVLQAGWDTRFDRELKYS